MRKSRGEPYAYFRWRSLMMAQRWVPVWGWDCAWAGLNHPRTSEKTLMRAIERDIERAIADAMQSSAQTLAELRADARV